MGTNFYTANEGERERHIGKSSAGWRFLADADDMETRSWLELRDKIAAAVVVDEYGQHRDDLIGVIEAKAGLRSHTTVEYPDWMTPRHDSMDGPVDFTEGGFS